MFSANGVSWHDEPNSRRHRVRAMVRRAGLALGLGALVLSGGCALSRGDGAPARGTLAITGSTSSWLIRQIEQAPNPGKSNWDRTIKRLLLDRFDIDGSGAIDKARELGAIRCEVWTTLIGRYPDLLTTYGFAPPPYQWVGSALGFGERLRAGAFAAARACVGRGGSRTTRRRVASGSLAARIRAIPKPGEASWDRVVKRLLVGRFDRNGSGTIDRGDELRAIGCDVWSALMGRYPKLLTTYGFAPKPYLWVGNALGFGRNLRPAAYRIARGCGRRSGGGRRAGGGIATLSGYRIWITVKNAYPDRDYCARARRAGLIVKCDYGYKVMSSAENNIMLKCDTLPDNTPALLQRQLGTPPLRVYDWRRHPKYGRSYCGKFNAIEIELFR